MRNVIKQIKLNRKGNDTDNGCKNQMQKQEVGFTFINNHDVDVVITEMFTKNVNVSETNWILSQHHGKRLPGNATVQYFKFHKMGDKFQIKRLVIQLRILI